MSKTFQQAGEEFEVKQKILRDIEDETWGMNSSFDVGCLKRWQRQLKDLSKEEKTHIICRQCGASDSCEKVGYTKYMEIKRKFGLVYEEKLDPIIQQAEEKFGKMTKEDFRRCFTCKKPFIKTDAYTWKGNCEHVSKDLRFSSGGIKEEKPEQDLREKTIEVLEENTSFWDGCDVDKILALLKTHPKEKPEKIEEDWNFDPKEAANKVFKPKKIETMFMNYGKNHKLIVKINEIINFLNSHPNIGGKQ